mmetsp:Transcript_9389/g.38479  ORF Transcript_9389/g.38479 Transcript_9389/m.38479 type:complete len:96 (-) Transcript_9389:41-328(-)
MEWGRHEDTMTKQHFKTGAGDFKAGAQGLGKHQDEDHIISGYEKKKKGKEERRGLTNKREQDQQTQDAQDHEEETEGASCASSEQTMERGHQTKE